jgi:hypothetical protein
MSTWTKQAWKLISSVVDDLFLLIVTEVCVLVSGYLPTIRGVLVEHKRPANLDWPGAVAIVLAGIVALIVVAVDSSRGTPEQKQARIGQRIGKCILLGLGAMAMLEKLILGAA